MAAEYDSLGAITSDYQCTLDDLVPHPRHDLDTRDVSVGRVLCSNHPVQTADRTTMRLNLDATFPTRARTDVDSVDACSVGSRHDVRADSGSFVIDGVKFGQ